MLQICGLFLGYGFELVFGHGGLNLWRLGWFAVGVVVCIVLFCSLCLGFSGCCGFGVVLFGFGCLR